MTQHTGPTLIQSVQRALRLMEVIAERGGPARAKELANATGIALPTTYHLLRTLTHEEYLERLEDGSYVLGQRMDVTRQKGAAGRAVVRARSNLERLRDEVGAAIYLARYVDGEIHILEVVDSPRTPRIDLWVGVHDAAHATALGKSILGQLTASEREDYLARHPLHDLTPRTTVHVGTLCERLPSAEEVAVDDGEYALGVFCLAAPVRTCEGVGSLGFISPRGPGQHVDDLAATLQRGAARVTRALALA